MMLHDSNEEKITQGSIHRPAARPTTGRALWPGVWGRNLWRPDVREGACLCRRGRVALHFWVGSLNA